MNNDGIVDNCIRQKEKGKIAFVDGELLSYNFIIFG